MWVLNCRLGGTNNKQLTVVARTKRLLNEWIAEVRPAHFVRFDPSGYIDNSNEVDVGDSLYLHPTKADIVLMF